jgi:hypothetical protein
MINHMNVMFVMLDFHGKVIWKKHKLTPTGGRVTTSCLSTAILSLDVRFGEEHDTCLICLTFSIAV